VFAVNALCRQVSEVEQSTELYNTLDSVVQTILYKNVL